MKYLRDIKEHMTIRKIIGLVLLAACVIFLLVNGSVIRRSIESYNGTSVKKEDETLIAEQAADREHQTSLIGNQRVEQPFTAETGGIARVSISIENPESHQTTGKIKVSVLDEKDQTVTSTSLSADMTKNNDFTTFSFKGDTEEINQNNIVSRKSVNRNQEGVKLAKGQTYKLVVESIDVQSTSTVAVNADLNSGDTILHITTFVKYHLLIGIFFALLMLADLVLLLLPEKPVRSQLAQRILFVLTPFASCFIMFKIAGIETMRIARHFLELDGWINLLLILMIQWILFTLINRLGISAIITVCLTFIFTVANYVLIAARNEPLAFNDLFVWKTAAGVAKSYSLTIDKFFVWGVVLTVFWICLILAFDEEKGCKTWKQRLIPLAVSGCLFGGVYGLFTTDFIPNHMYFSSFNPKNSYQYHGYALGFTMSIKNSVVQKPKDYSADAIKKITDQYQSDEAGKVTKPTETTPNIIVIMNEAFSDLNAVNTLQTNEDAMPFVHSLQENTIKGTMHTSVFGGRTANTEFEFLTGNTTHFLPYNAVPFKTMIHDRIPSFADTMAEQGYAGNIAFHPGLRDSYGRDVAYPNLGFEEYVSVEDIDDYEQIRAYMSDRSDYKIVEEQYEESRKETDKPFFLFNVTIQNHGGFKMSEGVVEGGGIEITDPSQYDEEALQYLNLVKISDKELKRIVNYFKKVDEPTVIVFFGDHQPALQQYYYDALLGKPFEKWSFEEIEQKYRVPFIIWANYDIQEETGVEISANYLHAYLMDKIGGKMTGYDKFLMHLRESVPVVTTICYYDDQGKIHNYEKEKKTRKDMQQYQWLQYNAMFDAKNRAEQFFHLKK